MKELTGDSRTCKMCVNVFEPRNIWHVHCGIECLTKDYFGTGKPMIVVHPECGREKVKV